MTSWADAHTRAAVLAAEWHSDLGLALDRPIDVFEAIRAAGLVLAFAPLGRVSGVYIPGPDAGSSSGVLLHSGHPRTRQRYTAAHELGHHAFGHAAEVDGDIERLRRGRTSAWASHEKEAEAFGAWLLMPRRLIRAGLQELGIGESPRDPLDVYALALWLGTSYTATAYHLATVRMISEDTAGRWARVAPREVKRAIAGSLVPDDLRNDVWWLDGRRGNHVVRPRAGDRIILTLEETPSSGFSWSMGDTLLELVADSFLDEWEPDLTSGGNEDGEVAGGQYLRSFALEVPEGVVGDVSLTLTKDMPWDPDAGSADGFELRAAIEQRRSGVQLDETALRQPA